MSGEHFVIVLCVGFAVFCVWLAVQIADRDKAAIWIAVALSGSMVLILAIFAYLVWQGIGV
jgi:type IV secretory pathway TrbF-like protein